MEGTNFGQQADFELAPDYGQLAPDHGPPPAWPTPFTTIPPAPPQPKRRRLKTIVGGLALAGLLVVGGAATVFAADPSPSPSTSPGVTTPGTSPGTTTPGTPGTRGNCPHNQTTTNTTTTSTGASS
jgi:serine protease